MFLYLNVKIEITRFVLNRRFVCQQFSHIMHKYNTTETHLLFSERLMMGTLDRIDCLNRSGLGDTSLSFALSLSFLLLLNLIRPIDIVSTNVYCTLSCSCTLTFEIQRMYRFFLISNEIVITRTSSRHSINWNSMCAKSSRRSTLFWKLE